MPLFAVAAGTCSQPTGRITFVIERHTNGGGPVGLPGWQARIVDRDRLTFGVAEAPGDPTHLSMLAATVRISLKLPDEIAGVQTSKPRRARAVAAPVEPVAGEAGIRGSRRRAAEGDQAAVRREPVGRGSIDGGAAAKDGTEQDRRQEQGSGFCHMRATARRSGWFQSAGLLPLMLGVIACKPPPDQRQFVPQGDVARGKATIERVGCGSCHSIPGVPWPKGAVGPALNGLAERGLIGGVLPNRPDILAAYVRNAPSLAPGSGMPAMPVTETEARDIVAYLYQQRGR